MPKPDTPDYILQTVLKRDAFSETVLAHRASDPTEILTVRRLGQLAEPGRTIGRLLARREARALAAVAGIPGTPALIAADRNALLRGWIEGVPLHQARPADPAFYTDAHRLLRAMRARGVTHNDLAKPQNWLRQPDGSAAVIDFQLAAVSRRRGRAFRLRAYEDLRHLLKLKARYAPDLLTPTERRIVDRRSLPSRIWRHSGKRLYNLVTRRLLNWSDGEGTGDRLARDGSRLEAAFRAHPGVRDAVVVGYARAGKTQGLYAFIEVQPGAEAPTGLPPGADLIQPVTALPRDASGHPRRDILEAIAGNRLDLLAPALAQTPDLAAQTDPIAAARLNLTDRY